MPGILSSGIFIRGLGNLARFIAAGGPAPFNPAAFGTLITWLSAQFANVTTDGATVVTAPDHGGLAGTYTAGANTIYHTNQINGKPAYQFDGVAAALVSGNVTHGIGAGDFWMGWIVNPDNASAGHDLFNIGNTALEVLQFGSAFRCDQAGLAGGAIYASGVWAAVEFWRAGGNVGVSLNGTVILTGTNAFSMADGAPLNLCGMPPSGDTPFPGKLADFLFLRGQTNQAALSAAWRGQYGL